MRTISIAEQIAEDVAVDILNGRLKVGERLAEEAIAARYGVSRGPVRSALRILERRGLAVFYPRRGAFVAELTPDSFRDVIEIRFWLLVLGVRRCARDRTEDGLRRVAQHIETLRRSAGDPATEPGRFAWGTAMMYQLIVDASGNRKLDTMLQETLDHTAWNLIWRNRELDYVTVERRKQAVATFDRLFDAISRKDEDEAERVARMHLDDSLAVFFQRMNPQGA